MGAGILPTTIHNGKLYFLFGKENKYETSAPGFSDFGGGTDNNETFFTTAVREAGEELTGFLGSSTEVRHMLRKFGTYHIDYEQNGHKTYRMYIFPYDYNEWLPYYYNNNQQFLQKHLSSDIFQKYKIFEKAEIRWICIDELKKMRQQFRHYFRNIVDMILEQKEDINKFIRKCKNKKTAKPKTKNNKKQNNKKTTKKRTNYSA